MFRLSRGKRRSPITFCRLNAELQLTLPFSPTVRRVKVIHIALFFKPNSQPPPLSTILHTGITVLLIVASLAIALMTCNLGFVLELTGGFSATALAYILPPLCYIKLSSGGGKAGGYSSLIGSSHDQGWMSLFETMRESRFWVYWICIFFGVVVLVMSTISAILGFKNQENKECYW